MKHLKLFENFEQPEGTGTETFWEIEVDGEPIRVTLTDVLDYVDGVIEVDPNEIKHLLIDVKRDPKRVDVADLSYPIILTKKDGKFTSIIDGQHRVVKSVRDNLAVKAKVLNLDDAPEKFVKVFG